MNPVALRSSCSAHVMPFGLYNAPVAFQHLVNDLFHDILDVFVIIYLDDILVYSDNEEEHVLHVRQVLERLQQNGLYAKLDTCAFHQSRISFLG